MYEDKKKKALHTLEKKQIKVDEINKVRRAGRWHGCGWGGQRRLSLRQAACQLAASGVVEDTAASGNIRVAVSLHPNRPTPQQVLTEDISPALDKLRREKVQYMEWQNATNSLEKLRRFCVAYKYVEAERCAVLRCAMDAGGEGLRGAAGVLSAAPGVGSGTLCNPSQHHRRARCPLCRNTPSPTLPSLPPLPAPAGCSSTARRRCVGCRTR